MPRTVLIVDDLYVNRRILAGMLGKDYDILEAATGEEALQVLAKDGANVSAVLLDIGMPGMDGYEVLRRIRSNGVLTQLPVIMITGSEDEETRIKSLALGANDFVMKPYSYEIIQHCLKNNISLKEAAATVNAMQRDKLTGLYNREAFFAKAQEMVAGREPNHYIMACFDIDKFKIINDQYGTQKGDEVLRHIATVFQTGFEPNGGICCRVSADNFAVLYPASFQNTAEIGEIRNKAAHVEGLVTPVIFSIGRYLIDDVSMSPTAMYDRASLAADSVKGRYDLKLAFYDEAMRERLIGEQQIVLEMEDALRTGQFDVWFQPQYNHATDAMIGAEALVRWRHPKKGMIPPNVFIPIFEQNGFIYSLDRFVWEQVCEYLHKWRADGRAPLPVSVNMSRYDVLRPDIVETLVSLVQRYELPMDLLRLEITESAFSESSQHIVETVRALVGRGFTVEIDDFGSGYSSLNTLKDVPAQIIKLDMKFLQNTSDSARGGNIVESVVRMAKWLGMSVIAEGVETLEQANYLRSVGCNYIQGYLYAKPMAAERYEALCGGNGGEGRLLTLETVENMDNNKFWDPESMDTLIFNSYVGGACIYEYHEGNIELIRATEKYAQVIGSAGMTVEDALKLNWTEHLDEENKKRVIDNLDESVRTKKEVTGEYVFLDLPGCPHETYLRSTMRVIAAAGNRYLVYCTNENITAQRQSEKRERLVTEQMQAILTNVDLGIIAAVVENGTARYLFTNDHYYQMLGCTKEQFEKEITSPYMTVAPEDRQRVMEETARINGTGESTTIVYRVKTRDGRRRVFRAAISMGRLTGIDQPVQMSILRDITEEMEAEQRERRAAEQIQAIVRDMPGGFVRMHLEPDGSVKPVFVNEGFERLVGMGSDEILAIYAADALADVHPDDVDIVRDAVTRMLRDGSAYSGRYRLRHGNGGYIWLSVFGRMTKDASGDAFLSVYYTDATEQVKEEETQRALLDNLPVGAGVYELKDGQMSLAYQNKSYWELVGLDEAAFPDVAPMSAIHPDDSPVIMRELASAMEQGRDVVCDVRLRHLTRGYQPVHLVGRIVPVAEDRFSIYTTFTPIADEIMSYQQMLPVALSAIMESTTDLSFVKDKNFRYITASRAFANLVGWKDAAELIGKTDYDLFDSALAEKYRKDDEALVESGRSIVDIVETIPSEDGAPRYSSTSKYLLRDGAGEVVGLYGTGRDITKSFVQDSQLRLVNDSIPGGLATYAVTAGAIRIVYCNDGFCKLFGGTREGLERRGDFNPVDWIYEEDRAGLLAQVDALVEKNAPIDCLYRIHMLGGGYQWINQKAAVAERRGGTVLFNAVLLNVTERQNAIEQLRISQEENSLAVQLSENIICRYSIENRTLTLSPEAAVALSLPKTICNVPDEPIQSGMISPESADAYRGFFEAILHGSRAATATFQQRYFGNWRWLEAKSTTVFSDEGKPVKAVISFLDITDRLERETVYKKWQQSLEDRPTESYTLFRCNLNNDTDRAAAEGSLITFDFDDAGRDFNERARAYINRWVFPEDRDKYTAFVNSDAMLAGYCRGRRSDTLEYRELLSGEGFRWLRLTVDLVECPNSTEVEAYLMYENIDETKRAELQTKELSETDPLTGLLNRNTFMERVERIVCVTMPERKHALLMLDIDGFKQVNDVFGHGAGDQALMDVAEGLTAILRRDDLVARLGGDEFMIFLCDVQDDASVAKKAKQICALNRRAFSMEVQISASIGVAMAPRDGMHFETLYKKADSALYYVKGSGKDNFTFYSDNMADEHLAPEPDATGSSGGRRTEKKRRMLIVDDNSIDHALLQNIFQREFILEKAQDGSDALIRLRHYGSAISVVLLDLGMPVMDGFAVLEKMQASAELRAIPVIIVSGDESRETCLTAIRKGATDFITKPVDPELLRIRVHSAVSRAENERLRAKNCLLELQNEERLRYESVLESSGVAFIEYNWLTGKFSYYPAITNYIAGVYDGRMLWQILLSDMVADTQTVQQMQQLVHQVAEDGIHKTGARIVKLKTPKNEIHTFRMNVRKLANEYQLTNRLIITLTDLDYDVPV